MDNITPFPAPANTALDGFLSRLHEVTPLREDALMTVTRGVKDATPYAGQALPAGMTHISCGLFEPQRGARFFRRTRDAWRGMWCVVLEDVGTKASIPPLLPTWRVETAPGNEHWVYVLDAPITDWEMCRDLLMATADAGLNDPSGQIPIRLTRLPGSLPEGKTHAARMVEWSGRIYSRQSLADGLGVTERVRARIADRLSRADKARVARPRDEGPTSAVDAKAREALRFIDNSTVDDRDSWLRAGMAMHALGATYDTFLEWSQRGASYDGEDEVIKAWESFDAHREGGIGPGTLFEMARGGGWAGSTSVLDVRDETVAAPGAAQPDLSHLDAMQAMMGVVPGAPVEEDDSRLDEGAIDWADLDENQRPPPTEHLMTSPDLPGRDLFPVGCVGILSGSPGSGKSGFALTIAIAMAAMKPLLGGRRTKEPLRCLLAFTEDPAPALRERMWTIAKGMGVPFASLRGVVDAVPIKSGPFLTILPDGTAGRAPNFIKLERSLQAAADAGRPYRFAVLDSFADIHTADEIRRGEMTMVMGALDQLADKFGVHILLVAHPPKRGGKLENMESAESYGDLISGSGAIYAKVRFGLALGYPDDAGMSKLIVSKSQYSGAAVRRHGQNEYELFAVDGVLVDRTPAPEDRLAKAANMARDHAQAMLAFLWDGQRTLRPKTRAANSDRGLFHREWGITAMAAAGNLRFGVAPASKTDAVAALQKLEEMGLVTERLYDRAGEEAAIYAGRNRMTGFAMADGMTFDEARRRINVAFGAIPEDDMPDAGPSKVQADPHADDVPGW